MILKWGSYAHSQNEVGVRITQRAIFDTFSRRMGEVIDWHILGAIHANSQSALTSALASLEDAYRTDNKNLILYLDNGTTETQHKLLTAECFGGTKVTGLGYMDGPWKMRCEYANRRTFWIGIRGERRVGTGYWSWRERLKIKGTGGRKFIYMPQLVGAPTGQTIQTQTTFFYVQEGMATGRETYIAPPGPLYPGIEHESLREIEYYSPRDIRYGGQKEMFVTTWRYVMEATAAQGFTSFIVPVVT